MEAINHGCCKLLSWRPNSKTLRSKRVQARCKVVRMKFSGHHGGDDGDYYMGRSVDESMILLRLRIKEMKIMEEKKNEVTPADWMEWEKQCYAHYDRDVCKAVGLLQSYLMNLRPSVALGMFAFVAFSVMISFGLGLFHAMEIVYSLLCIARSVSN